MLENQSGGILLCKGEFFMKSYFENYECPENELQEVVGRVWEQLRTESSFVLWLDGPMGAGKTTFVRNFLWLSGLDRRIPVVSPTYTLMNEYEIDVNWFAHVDLYRAESNFSLEELGVLDARDFKGIFVEWPEAAAASGGVIEPTHRLKIRYAGDSSRLYSFLSGV